MTKKKSTTALSTISKNDIAKEGIEVKLTQNDIIELMVEEKLNEIKAQAHALAEEGKVLILMLNRLEQELDAVAEKEKEKILSSLKVTFGNIKKVINVSRHISSDSQRYAFQTIDVKGIPTIGERGNCITKTTSFCMHKTESIDILVRLRVITEFDVEIELNVPVKNIKFKENIDLELLNNHARKVHDFVSRCGDINAADVKKHIRLTFNKELLKAMSDEFKDKLYTSFGMSL